MTDFEKKMDKLGEKYDNLVSTEENDKLFLKDLNDILDECDMDKKRVEKLKNILNKNA